MQSGKKSPVEIRQFAKLGAMRGAWKPPSWLTKLKPSETFVKTLTLGSGASAESLNESRLRAVQLEAKRAAALCEARRSLNIPR
jgi:hypothetical protein